MLWAIYAPPWLSADWLLTLPGNRYSEGSDTWSWVFIYLVPNSFWLIFPSMVVWSLGSRISLGLHKRAQELRAL